MALLSRATCRLRVPSTRAARQSQSRQQCRRRFTDAASRPSSRVQVYISNTNDPFLNLSIEHFLLQKSHPESTILFLYTNRPCVVIGRNQNPWTEVNLGLLRRGIPSPEDSAVHQHEAPPQEVSLVRRRSGGGTVFHDLGNANYSVICPPAAFDRNKHAEMVVRALQGLGVGNARVNDRHDIVVDVDVSDASSGERHDAVRQPFKISGSAYKLTRLRSLHHGTCLLSSPNLASIGKLLRSPAEPYIKARGVESVRSRIRNVNVGNAEFEDAVVQEFRRMYGDFDVETRVGDAALDDVLVRQGYDELKSLEWLFTQTPQFTFSTHPSEADPRERPPLPLNLASNFHATITARHGQIQEASFAGLRDSSVLNGQLIHQIRDWRDVLRDSKAQMAEPVGEWLNGLFGSDPNGQ